MKAISPARERQLAYERERLQRLQQRPDPFPDHHEQLPPQQASKSNTIPKTQSQPQPSPPTQRNTNHHSSTQDVYDQSEEQLYEAAQTSQHDFIPRTSQSSLESGTSRAVPRYMMRTTANEGKNKTNPQYFNNSKITFEKPKQYSFASLYNTGGASAVDPVNGVPRYMRSTQANDARNNEQAYELAQPAIMYSFANNPQNPYEAPDTLPPTASESNVRFKEEAPRPKGADPAAIRPRSPSHTQQYYQNQGHIPINASSMMPSDPNAFENDHTMKRQDSAGGAARNTASLASPSRVSQGTLQRSQSQTSRNEAPVQDPQDRKMDQEAAMRYDEEVSVAPLRRPIANPATQAFAQRPSSSASLLANATALPTSTTMTTNSSSLQEMVASHQTLRAQVANLERHVELLEMDFQKAESVHTRDMQMIMQRLHMLEQQNPPQESYEGQAGPALPRSRSRSMGGGGKPTSQSRPSSPRSSAQHQSPKSSAPAPTHRQYAKDREGEGMSPRASMMMMDDGFVHHSQLQLGVD